MEGLLYSSHVPYVYRIVRLVLIDELGIGDGLRMIHLGVARLSEHVASYGIILGNNVK